MGQANNKNRRINSFVVIASLCGIAYMFDFGFASCLIEAYAALPIPVVFAIAGILPIPAFLYLRKKMR